MKKCLDNGLERTIRNVRPLIDKWRAVSAIMERIVQYRGTAYWLFTSKSCSAFASIIVLSLRIATIIITTEITQCTIF